MKYLALLLLAGLVVVDSATTMAALDSTTVDDCDDDVNTDCWSRPDGDCFGIYEPWSRVHCPLRCGFCPDKLPPCEDKLGYCNQFEDNTCTDDNYQVWARVNCRKHCNLCHIPTTPSPTDGGSTTAGGPGVTGVTGLTSVTDVKDDNMTMPSDVNTTHAVPTATPHDIPGTVAKGLSNIIMIEAPGTDEPGMCLYHGQTHKQGERWTEGCDYDCVCMDSTKNRVLCEEKCTRWELVSGLTGCKLVKEDHECCMRLECS